MNEKLDAWINEEALKLEEKRKTDMEAAGMKPFLKLNEGETSFEVDRSKVPRAIVTKNGPMKVFSLLNPADKELGASEYLYSIIVPQLALQKDGRVRLLRTGAGKETKYKCLEVK